MHTSQKIYEIRRAREKRAALPYTVAYIAIFWVGLLVNLPSEANTVERNCRAFGDVVYQIAKRRDEGMTRFEVRELMLSNFENETLQLALDLVEMVFDRPWVEPQNEAAAFIRACVKNVSYERTSTF